MALLCILIRTRLSKVLLCHQIDRRSDRIPIHFNIKSRNVTHNYYVQCRGSRDMLVDFFSV
jgi:hypothetical protein